MRKVCSFCGKRNPVAATVCSQCSSTLEGARLEKFHLPWAAWVPSLIVVVILSLEFYQLRQALSALERRTESERAQNARQIAETKKGSPEMEAAFLKEQAELDARQRARLQDTNLVSGKLAAQRHAEEWKRRQNHDPELAETWLEKSMVEAEKLGRNSEIASEVALRLRLVLLTNCRVAL